MKSSTFETYLRNSLRDVKRSGESYIMASCPVHKGGAEETPSFSVNIKTGSFRCFACRIRGNVADLQKLLKDPKLGSFLPNNREEDETYNDNVNEAILGVFHRCPEELLESGFTEKTLLEHEVGYDILYDRITYPIRTSEGRLVAISGRAKDGEEPRYKVYSKTMMRNSVDENYKPKPKDWLWMAHKIDKTSNVVLIVEGFKARMWAWQCGVQNVVATMGTMVTANQKRELRKFADRAIIMFDMDKYGREAAKKLQIELLEFGIPCSTVTYEGDQPDDLTVQQFQQLAIKYNIKLK